ncbi:MAG: TetR/AcrR family transcriptional regulator [Candidatus Promineifilaceae bacterium]
MNNTSTRRERRAAARKAQILEAAAAVFSRKGYERATTREIAEAADVSEGTLYNYFHDKRALLSGVAKAYADEVTAEIASIETNDFHDMMAQLLTRRLRGGRERRLFMLFLHEARLNPDVKQHYVQEALHRIIHETENQLTHLVQRGLMRDINPAVAARTLSATIMGFAVMYELGGDLWAGMVPGSDAAYSPEQLGLQVADIYLHGLEKRRAGDD